MTQLIQSLSEVSGRYDALFVDLWGCVHDGRRAIPSAVAALQAYRASGGAVVLVTNSPQPRVNVERQLDHFGVARDAWDTIATSGDSARAAMFEGVVGRKVWFIGELRDQGFFTPLKVLADPVEITQVPLDEAEGIVCCGPRDPDADPETMRGEFLVAQQRGLKLLCANPDIVVDRGETREWCAGALARLYTEMGGESLYFGKPHPPIYDLARRRLAELGRERGQQRHPRDRRWHPHRHFRRDGRGHRFAVHHRRACRGRDAAPRCSPTRRRCATIWNRRRSRRSFAIGFLR